MERLVAAIGAAYRVERELGGGGMSHVFLAEEVELGRRVVIKVLPPEMAAGVNRDRFKREIQLAAALQHPHIVPLLTAGAADDLLWYTMPYVEGESLRDRLRRGGAMSKGDTIQVLRDVLEALEYAHERGVVHRDIKPDNVMCSGRHALVTDFGVAKALDPSSGAAGLTSVGITLGTPAYMAPEQAAGDPEVDHRADLYAVGTMAYEMFVGEPPFIGSPRAVLAMHMTQAPDRLGKRSPGVPPPVEELVMRLLEKEPSDRWQRAGDLLSHFDTLSASGTLTSNARIVLQRTRAARVTTLLLLAAVGILSLAWWTVRLAGLPSWVWNMAAVLLVVAMPIIFAASRLERRRALARGTLTSVRGLPQPLRRLSTVRGAVTAAIVGFAALAAGAGGFMVLRAAGVRPFATLVTSGAVRAGGTVVVADFLNHTPDSLLASTISAALRIDLTRSSVVKVMEDADVVQVLRRMERNPATRLDEQLAREVAERQNAVAVVSGEVATLGAGFVLLGKVLSVGDGSTLLAERETAPDADGVIAAVDRLSRRLREGIGESLRSIRSGVPLETVTTRSLEALRAFSVATDLLAQGRNAEGQRFLEDAVRIDSTFAMAWRGLAVVYNNTQQPRTRVISASTRAYALRDRLPDRERLLAVANYYMRVTREPEQAAITLRQLLATSPEDVSALNNLGTMLRTLGRHDEAAAVYRQALAIRPVTPLVGNLILTLSDLGSFAAAESVVSEGLRRFPNSPNRWQWKGALALARNDFAATLAISDSASRETDPRARRVALSQRTAALEALGQLVRAAATRQARAALEMDDRATGAALQVLIERAVTEASLLGPSVALDRTVDSLRAMHSLAELDPEDRPYAATAEFLLLSKRVADAKRVLSEWEADLPEQRDEAGPIGLEALVLLVERRPEEALPRLRASRERPYSCSVCMLWEIALAFDALGQVDSALVAYRAVVTTPSRFDNSRRYRVLAPAHLRMAELYASKGEADSAHSHFESGAALWRNADPALKQKVDDARRRIQSLSPHR